MMTLFKERFSSVVKLVTDLKQTEEFISASRRDQIRMYRSILRDSRKGDYLIKVSKNNTRNFCGEDAMYVEYTYSASGYYVLGPRKNAQWFTGKEAFQWVSNAKGFTIVKRRH